MTSNNNTTDFEQSNREIAEFMGYVFSKSGKSARIGKGIKTSPYRMADLHYHNNWNLLMPVVEKIEAIELKNSHYAISITGKICSIYNMKKIRPYLISRGEADTKLLATYTAILQFINYIKRKEDDRK